MWYAQKMKILQSSHAVSTLASQPVELTHVHRWRIDEQAGAASTGRCGCGTERSFQNGWDTDSGLQLSGNWLRRRGPVATN